MDDLLEFLFDYIFDFATNSSRVPKIVRYILVIVVFTILICASLVIGFSSSMPLLNFLGVAIAIIILIVGVWQVININGS